jgi:hypothetical protein
VINGCGPTTKSGVDPLFFASVHSQLENQADGKMVKHLMRLKRRTTRATIVSILMGMLMSLGLVAVSSGTASASSIYDTTYKSTSSLVQVGNYGCSNQDITYSWSNYLTNDEFSGVKGFEYLTHHRRLVFISQNRETSSPRKNTHQSMSVFSW